MPRSSFQKYISEKVSDIDTCLAINTIAHIVSPAPPPPISVMIATVTLTATGRPNEYSLGGRKGPVYLWRLMECGYGVASEPRRPSVFLPIT